MILTPLQIILILAWLLFVIFAVDAYQRRRFNALHFIIFFWWTWLIALFSTNIPLLNKIWSIFWLNRWADLIVYSSIIILLYLYFELLNKTTRHSMNSTRIITSQAIQNAVYMWVLDDFKMTKSKYHNFAVLIRSYNEAKTLPSVISAVSNKWFKNIIVVDDWSTDETLTLLNAIKDKESDLNIIILSHLINRWWWAANKTWFEFIKRYSSKLWIDWIFTFDADGQMDINDTDKFIEIINKNKDVEIILWSRFIFWAKTYSMPLLRRIVLFWSKIVTYVFNSMWFSDPHNWYRAISSKAISKIKIDSDNMTYASELLEEIKRNKLIFKEVPVDIAYTQYSLAKGQKNANAIKILVEIVYRKFFYK